MAAGNNTTAIRNESTEYEPPPILVRRSNPFYSNSAVSEDVWMDMIDAIDSDNHSGNNEDEDDNKDDLTDAFQSRIHYYFPSELLEMGIDYNYSSTVDNIVTDEELKADEEFLQSLNAAREERERNFIVYTTEGQDRVAGGGGDDGGDDDDGTQNPDTAMTSNNIGWGNTRIFDLFQTSGSVPTVMHTLTTTKQFVRRVNHVTRRLLLAKQMVPLQIIPPLI